MKRCKQRADRAGQAKPEHVSGCRQFEGEDLMYNNRMALNAQNQRDWADQQIRERRANAAAEVEEEKCFAEQEQAILRVRSMLEDENAEKKANYQRMIADENKRLAREKRERENAWKNDQEASNQFETTLTNHNEELLNDGKTLRTDNWQ